MTVREVPRGRRFPLEDAGGAFLYLVRRGAVALRDEQDQLVAKFGEGDAYSACGDEPELRGISGTVIEDSVLFLLPCEALHGLRAAHPSVDRYFATALREKLRSAVDALHAAPVLGGGLLQVDAGALVKRPPVHVDAGATIRDAAALMTREGISSVLVLDRERLVGIVTDRDLRERCIARGVPPHRQVREVMSAGVHRIAKEAPAFEALLTMTRLGIRHLPVVDRDAVIGVVSATDLVRHQSGNSVCLGKSVRRSGSVAALVQASVQLAELQIQLVAAGATARQIGQAIGAVSDAMTTRLLEFAEAEFGVPPVGYAWLACGSQARHEQTISSDQDNALLLSDAFDPGEHGAYFGCSSEVTVATTHGLFVEDAMDRLAKLGLARVATTRRGSAC